MHSAFNLITLLERSLSAFQILTVPFHNLQAHH
uniref:Uncharacterized protein n=1 Tax=Setaria italica TaxID=4555 RepID=K3Z1P4_SETIT